MDNKKLVEICQEYGTPAYLYDIDKVISQYNNLKNLFSWKKIKIYYAMKANYNVDILKALRDIGASIDTVSPTEVLLCLKLGFKQENILYTANNLTDENMHLVHKLGVLLNIDSLSRFEKYAEAYPNNNVCLRFNSDVVAGAHEHIQTGGDKTKFGILLEDVDKVKEIADKYSMKIVGLHEHTGSGIEHSHEFYQAIKNLLSIASKKNFPDLEFIDFGGGLKVTYKPDEMKVDYKDFAKEVDKIFSGFCKEYGRELDLYFEPGKYIVAESGTLLVRVNTLKDNRGRFIAGTNSGFNHLIRPLLYGAYHHITNISNPKGDLKSYDICGNICETGDLFASEREIPEIREGDYLAILNAGAYGASMSSIYNLRPLARELVVQSGKVKVSREALTYEELAESLITQYKA